MTLLLDGHLVQGKNLKVTANLRMESGDMSGQTSNTEKAHKGFKPKTLAITLLIPFVDKDQLRDLMRLAEATAGGGQLHLYRVVNDTAEAFGVRQVEFTDGVSAREDDTLRQWQVQFTLSERQSNPESRRAAPWERRQRPGRPRRNSRGQAGEDATNGAAELTGFEKTLSKLDRWLGGGATE